MWVIFIADCIWMAITNCGSCICMCDQWRQLWPSSSIQLNVYRLMSPGLTVLEQDSEPGNRSSCPGWRTWMWVWPAHMFSKSELDHWWTFTIEGQQFSDIWHNFLGKQHAHTHTRMQHAYAVHRCSLENIMCPAGYSTSPRNLEWNWPGTFYSAGVKKPWTEHHGVLQQTQVQTHADDSSCN